MPTDLPPYDMYFFDRITGEKTIIRSPDLANISPAAAIFYALNREPVRGDSRTFPATECADTTTTP